MSEKIVQLNEAVIKELVRGSVALQYILDSEEKKDET